MRGGERRWAGRSILGLAAGVLIASCGEEAEQFVSLPAAPSGTRTVVLGALTSLQTALLAYAVDAPPDGWEVELSDDEQGELVVMFFEETPEEMRLPLGAVVEATPESCGVYAFPTELEVQTREFDGEWAVSEVPSSLRGFRFDGVCPCVAFDVQRIERPPTSIIVGFPLDAQRAFFADTNASSMILEDGALRDVDLGIAPHRVSSGFAKEDGEIWLGANNGVLLRSGDDGFVATATPSLGAIFWMDGDPGGSDEAFLQSADGHLVRHFGGVFTRLYAAEVPRRDRQNGSIAWLAPDHALMVLDEHDTIVEYRQGEVIAEVWSLAEFGFVQSVDRTRQGLLATTDQSFFLRRDEAGTWRALPDAPKGTTPRRVIDYREGFLYAGTNGLIGQWDERVGFCPTFNINTLVALDSVFEWGERVVATGRIRNRYFGDGEPSGIFVLTPRSE